MNLVNWDELEDAYGQASDIPGLLDDLSTYPKNEGYEDEPFFSLWSALCHQGTIYTASFAAVPIVVSFIENASHDVHYDYYLLPLSIHLSHLKGNGPEIPTELKAAYFEAIGALPDLASKEHPDSELKVRIISAAIAVKFGNVPMCQDTYRLI